MEIIFDEKRLSKYGDPDDPDNTPEKLVERTRSTLQRFGEFVGADKIEFRDEHKKEVFIITKGDKVITLTAQGDGVDGGWLNIGSVVGK